MFTGIVEEMGTIRKVVRQRGSVLFSIEGRKTGRSLRANDSIAVDGVCLTVIRRKKTIFDVQAVEETLKKTTLGRLAVSSKVNLERPLTGNSRLGGHFVLGHVDGAGIVEKIDRRKSSWLFWIRIPGKHRRLLIPVGSVAVNGVSLTVAALKADRFGVSIIPHTWRVTTFRRLSVGDRVNIELDMLGKYVAQLLRARRG
ncbi:MAG TPA: riboflavin synthase [Bacteroidota bacterium]|nr:riboflavin synthase [Bacteroidota bacterium]